MIGGERPARRPAEVRGSHFECSLRGRAPVERVDGEPALWWPGSGLGPYRQYSSDARSARPTCAPSQRPSATDSSTGATPSSTGRTVACGRPRKAAQRLPRPREEANSLGKRRGVQSVSEIVRVESTTIRCPGPEGVKRMRRPSRSTRRRVFPSSRFGSRRMKFESSGEPTPGDYPVHTSLLRSEPVTAPG